MNRLYYIVVLSFLSLFSSCVDIDKINIKSVTGVDVVGVGSENIALELGMLVENQNRQLKLRDATIEVVNGDKKILEIKSTSVAKVPKGENEVVLPLRIKLNNSNGIIGMLTLIKDLKGSTTNITIRGGTSIFNKRYKVEDVSMSELEDVLGFEFNEIIKKL